jgi:hypothetical protein
LGNYVITQLQNTNPVCLVEMIALR